MYTYLSITSAFTHGNIYHSKNPFAKVGTGYHTWYRYQELEYYKNFPQYSLLVQSQDSGIESQRVARILFHGYCRLFVP